MKELILFLIILMYANLIRYCELKEYSYMYNLKQYFLNKQGIQYNITFVIIYIMYYFINKI
jgi:hypothetical protein